MVRKWIFALLIQVVAMSATAMADTIWSWSYTGSGVTASGTFTTSGSATSPESVLSITGTRNGQQILGLVALGLDSGFLYDNLFINSAPFFSNPGLLFDVGGGVGHTNLYSIGDQLYDFTYADSPPGAGVVPGIAVQFTVEAVPEPQPYVLILVSLAILGIAGRKFIARTD
jgi:hypothetical protein